MTLRTLSAIVFTLAAAGAVGCGPTRTAGTQGVAADKLAVLHITPKLDVPVLQLSAIGFDDGEMYKLDGKDRDFFLTPGVHRVDIDLVAKVESPIKGFSIPEAKIQAPKGLTTGDLQPGKKYELRGVNGTMQGMMGVDDEGPGITQEMTSKPK
jgi:hypothetical protein